MSTWNYRVMRTHDGDETTYGIHEVYYDNDGDVTFWTDPEVVAETVEGLREELIHMLAALESDVLDNTAEA